VRSGRIEPEEWGRIERALEAIIPTYERVNRLLSLNLIESWWERCAEEVEGCQSVLEIGCGTGCLSRLIRADVHVCTDPGGPMLAETRMQTERRKSYVRCVAEDLPFKDGSFDAVVSSFAFRDFMDKRRTFDEVFRVLRPDGKLVIAEVTKTEPASSKLIYWYFKLALPILAKVTSPGSKDAEDRWLVLPETYRAFGYVVEYEGMMREAGFEEVGHKRLRGGFALLLTGVRP
jgi:demethylmenaquinone methyltransferase/2-methoxy-6-polyprenyl-1,4-benzoquinol methylase